MPKSRAQTLSYRKVLEEVLEKLEEMDVAGTYKVGLISFVQSALNRPRRGEKEKSHHD